MAEAATRKPTVITPQAHGKKSFRAEGNKSGGISAGWLAAVGFLVFFVPFHVQDIMDRISFHGITAARFLLMSHIGILGWGVRRQDGDCGRVLAAVGGSFAGVEALVGGRELGACPAEWLEAAGTIFTEPYKEGICEF